MADAARAEHAADLPPAFVKLVELACENQLPAERVGELEEFLSECESRQQFYIDYFRLDAELSAQFHDERALRLVDALARNHLARAAEKSIESASMFQRVRREIARPKPLSLTIAAIVIATLLTSMAVVTPPFYRAITKKSDSPELRQLAARITATQEAEWPPGRVPQTLFVGERLELLQGYAEVTFERGAVVLMHAPCTLEVQAGDRGKLIGGRIVAKVPPRAIGFRVDTPAVELVDLGTEFGVSVVGDTTETHVFIGKVQATQTTKGMPKQRVELTAGEAATFSNTHEVITKVAASEHQFFRKPLPHGNALARLAADYRPTYDGISTAGLKRGNGLPATRQGYWNYYSSATQNPTDRAAQLALLRYGSGGDAGNHFYVGYQGQKNVPAVSNVEIFRGPIDRPPRPGELAVHPSDAGQEFAVMRWTPADNFAGQVEVRGCVRVLGTSAFDGVTFAIYAGGRELWQGKIESADNVGWRFVRTAKPTTGESIDFVVGRNGNWSNDQVGLSASIFAVEEQ